MGQFSCFRTTPHCVSVINPFNRPIALCIFLKRPFSCQRCHTTGCYKIFANYGKPGKKGLHFILYMFPLWLQKEIWHVLDEIFEVKKKSCCKIVAKLDKSCIKCSLYYFYYFPRMTGFLKSIICFDKIVISVLTVKSYMI